MENSFKHWYYQKDNFKGKEKIRHFLSRKPRRKRLNFNTIQISH